MQKNPVLRSQVVQKHVAGWIWPVGYSLQTAGLISREWLCKGWRRRCGFNWERGWKDSRMKTCLTPGFERGRQEKALQSRPTPPLHHGNEQCLLLWGIIVNRFAQNDSLAWTKLGRFSAFYSKGVIGPPACLKLRLPELGSLSLLTRFTSYTFYQRRRIAAFLIFSCQTLFQMHKALYPHDVSWLFPGLWSEKHKKV